MSASFPSPGTGLYTTATPVTAYPFTMSAWCYNVTTAIGTIMCIGSTTTVSSYTIRANGTGAAWGIMSRAAGTNTETTFGSITANSWSFLVGRFINATNRRMSVLKQDGTIQNGQSVASSTTTTLDSISLGAERASSGFTSPLNGGYIQDATIWNADIQPDGLVMSDQTLQRLAYEGPFSLSRALPNLVFYKRLKSSLLIDTPAETYYPGRSPLVWADSAGTLGYGPHCHYLGPGYAGPLDLRTPGII